MVMGHYVDHQGMVQNPTEQDCSRVRVLDKAVPQGHRNQILYLLLSFQGGRTSTYRCNSQVSQYMHRRRNIHSYRRVLRDNDLDMTGLLVQVLRAQASHRVMDVLQVRLTRALVSLLENQALVYQEWVQVSSHAKYLVKDKEQRIYSVAYRKVWWWSNRISQWSCLAILLDNTFLYRHSSHRKRDMDHRRNIHFYLLACHHNCSCNSHQLVLVREEQDY
jgi:hypothetical protein